MEITLYQTRHRADIIALLQQFWQTDRKQAERHFALKYEENPYTNCIHLAVLEGDGGRVKGIRPLLYLPTSDGASFFQLADAFLLPEVRGQGMQQKMLAFLIKTIETNYNNFTLAALSSNDLSQRSYRRFGLQKWGTYKLYGLREVGGKFLKALDKLGLLSPLPARNTITRKHNLRIWEPKNFPGFETLMLNRKHPFTNLLTDPAFWAWKNGLEAYPIRFFGLNDVPENFLVGRFYPGRELRILWWHTAEPDALQTLLKGLHNTGIGRIRVLLPEYNPENQIFKSSGFMEISNGSRTALYLPRGVDQNLVMLPLEACHDSFF